MASSPAAAQGRSTGEREDPFCHRCAGRQQAWRPLRIFVIVLTGWLWPWLLLLAWKSMFEVRLRSEIAPVVSSFPRNLFMIKA